MSSLDLVLIHPPVALPCEPPVGMGRLAAALRQAGLQLELVDSSVEALLFLLETIPEERAQNTTHRRALRGRGRALDQLRGPEAYLNLDRYRHAVRDLSSALALANPGAARVGLANYLESSRSPLSSEDLRAAAREPERSPFFAYYRRLVERVAEREPRLVGLSVNYLHQALPALALAGVLRARLPRTPIFLGGALCGCFRGRLREDAFAPVIDRLVFEDGLDALAAALLPEGGAVPDQDAICSTPPDYTGLPFASYLAPTRIVPVPTSRGCVWGRCNYCPEAISGTRFQPVNPARVPALLAATWERAEAGLLHLCDNAIPPSTLSLLATERWPVRWYGFARFSPELARPEVARGLRRAGCRMLQLGLESASPRVLARLRKGVSPTLAQNVLHSLSDAGVSVYLSLMFGTQGESRDDALRTLEFVEAHAEEIGFLNTSLLNLPLESSLEQDLTLVPLAAPDKNDLTLYTGFHHPEGWERRDARRFLEREFARSPAVAALLRRTPPIFGANHAPFFAPDPPRAPLDGNDSPSA